MPRELRREECVELEVGEPVKAETDRAIGVFFDDGDGELVWVPKSMLHDDSEVYQRGDTGTLIVSEWWAKQKGLV